MCPEIRNIAFFWFVSYDSHMKKKKKTFILDTNVVLYDPGAIFSFQENEVVIPITLLEEVDNFKKGNEIIHFNARQFSRELDALFKGVPLTKEVKLPGGGTLRIDTHVYLDDAIRKLFWEDKPDHRILACAYYLAQERDPSTVIIVSKDINLRMKARAIGLVAEDYETGKIKNIEELYTGKRIVENVEENLLYALQKEKQLPKDFITVTPPPMPNEFFVLRNHQKSILATFSASSDGWQLIEKRLCYGISPRNAEQAFALHALLDPTIQLVTLAGKAGTGKTLMALAGALASFGQYKQILLARPIIPLSNRDMGFLPGSIEEKLDPYMQPLYDNLAVIEHQFPEGSAELARIHAMLDDGRLQITPLAYIRGRSLSKLYFIVDEAQNLTPHEVKTIITRAGEGTKIVFTGDPYQIDTPYLDSRSNGLSFLIDRMKGVSLYAHITLEKGERSLLAEVASNLL